MTVKIAILLVSIALILSIVLLIRFRPDLIEKWRSTTSKSTIGFWAGIGIVVGAGIGAGTENVGVGVAIGLCLGTAIGAALNKRGTTSS